MEEEDEAVFCFSSSWDQGGNCELLAPCMSMEALGLTQQTRSRVLFLCVRESTSFYLCQDLVLVMSGELVYRTLGELKHEKPLFTVWLQHTNIREASLV